MGRYPFRFYGARPADWTEGANLGHAYELRFAKAPAGKLRLAIARAFEEGLADTNIATGGTWQWSGDWAMFLVGEKIGRADGFCDSMEAALRAVHEVAPVVEAHFAGVTEPSKKDLWSTWSVKQGAPSTAPEWNDHDLSLGFYAPKRKRAKITVDKAFEAECAKWRPTVEIDEEVVEVDDDPSDLFLLPSADEAALKIDSYDRCADSRKIGKHHVVLVDDDRSGSELYVKINKQLVRVKVPSVEDREWAFCKGNPTMLFVGDGKVWTVDLATAKPTAIGTYKGESEAAGASSDGWWVRSEKGTFRFPR